MKRAAALLVAAALVLGSAGCGDGSGARLSKNQYEAKMQSLDRGLASTERNLLNPGPPDVIAAAATFGALADAFEGFDKQLGSFRTPRDIQPLQDRLAAAAGQAASELRAMATKLSGASRQRIELLLRQFDQSKLQAALREIELAATAIRAKGYRIGASAA